MEIVDITLQRLSHLPFIWSNKQQVASWSDVREICVWCPNPACKVALNALKCLLGYPASEQHMHPCSQLEHLLFLKQFVVIPHGTLLVNINAIKNPDSIATLHHMIKKKHARSKNPTVVQCSSKFSEITDRYTKVPFRVPLKSLTRTKVLPAVRRSVENTSSEVEDNGGTKIEKEKANKDSNSLRQNDKSSNVKLQASSKGFYISFFCCLNEI